MKWVLLVWLRLHAPDGASLLVTAIEFPTGRAACEAFKEEARKVEPDPDVIFQCKVHSWQI